MKSSPLTPRCHELLNAFVGRRTGIVRGVRFVPIMDGDADLIHAAAEVTNPLRDEPLDFRNVAGGSGLHSESALLAALGEAIERYAASQPTWRNVQPCSRSELLEDFLAPESFAQFSLEQRKSSGFPFAMPTAETRLRWLPGKTLHTNQRCFIPAFAASLGYVPAAEEAMIGPGISTGLACAPSLEEAKLRALCEVVERDALARTWLGNIPPQAIKPDWLRNIASDLLPPRDTVQAFQLASEFGLTVAFVVCRGRGPFGELLSVGSACAFDPVAAFRKAALEASQDRVYIRQLLRSEPEWRPGEQFEQVTDFSHHARFYSVCPELVERAFAPLFQRTVEPIEPQLITSISTNPTLQWQQLTNRLLAAGFVGAWIEFTPPEARALSLAVVKVLVPGLLPLHGHHALPYRGHARLQGKKLWPYPHPFP